MGIEDIEGIDRDAIRDYIRLLNQERGNRRATVENHLSAVSSFLDYLVYEGLIEANIALSVRKRYLRRYKSDNSDAQKRKLVDSEQLRGLIDSIMVPRDRAIIILLAKTGVRRGELITIDIGDVDLVGLKIELKHKAKRSNRIVFFDEECARVLCEWLEVRKRYAREGVDSLFITEAGGRLDRNGVYYAVTRHAARIGLHNESSDRLEDHFTPHCLRHWNTTYLMRNGMPREMVQELRGDVRKEAIDIYYHLDEEQVRMAYLKCIPQLGVR